MSDLTPGSPEWLRIPSYPNYLANTQGLIRGPSGRVLSPSRNAKGYRRVQVCTSAGIVTRYVHRLVAEAFLGPVADLQVDHIDNDPSNNAVENLQIVTLRAHAAIGIERRPTCKRGHLMEWRDWSKRRRSCTECERIRESRRSR